ncbi:hypothetical protein F5144DRAFT_631550 [Chaetomium tenue]|uniref:Uncharacterized protein n=1 Tax=Chaetomium tenue TaxID=1854479 RepID=A0ACB7P3Y9_9PEZI|nr:hypothetical protein F5144DRAFT_631550 [Chaetomium globosum]
MPWYRTLMFHIPDAQTQSAVIDIFRDGVPKLVNKNNKPYVKLLQASRLVAAGPLPKGSKEAQKNQPKDGFTVFVTMAFQTYRDIVYYDNEDPAHKKIREKIKDMKLSLPVVLTTQGWMGCKHSIDEAAYVFVDPESEDDKKEK